MNKIILIILVICSNTLLISCQRQQDNLTEELWNIKEAKFIATSDNNWIYVYVDKPDTSENFDYCSDINGGSSLNTYFKNWISLSGYPADSINCLYQNGYFLIYGMYPNKINFDSTLVLSFNTKDFFYKFRNTGGMLFGYSKELIGKCKIRTPTCKVIN